MSRDPKKLQQAMKAQMSKPASETARPIEVKAPAPVAEQSKEVRENEFFRAGPDYFTTMRELVYETNKTKQELLLEGMGLLFAQYAEQLHSKD